MGDSHDHIPASLNLKTIKVLRVSSCEIFAMVSGSSESLLVM